MKDNFHGFVTKIIDGDTFEILITHVGKSNKYTYSKVEKVRIAFIDAYELYSKVGYQTKALLARKLLSKSIICYVHARDIYGRIVADIELL